MKDESAIAIAEFNEHVRKDDRVTTVTVPFRDGVSIVQRRCTLLCLLLLVTSAHPCLKIFLSHVQK